LIALWTFDSPAKLERFVPILENHAIPYELSSKGKPAELGVAISVAVEEGDLVKAKKYLLRYRKRRTSGDSL
jgi:hypothetical protein